MKEEIKILLVEDEEGMALVIKILLEEAGFQVVGVGTGGEALEQLDREEFSLVLLDYRLPDMTGLDVMEHLGPRVESLSIFMITGYDDSQLADRLLSAGADRFIQKAKIEFVDELVAAVKNFLAEEAVAILS